MLHDAFFARRLHELGYPAYLPDIIGTAKLLGIVALLTSDLRRLKEWAYAGFAIEFVGATWSHIVIQGIPNALPLMIAITTLSYVEYHKLGGTWI